MRYRADRQKGDPGVFFSSPIFIPRHGPKLRVGSPLRTYLVRATGHSYPGRLGIWPAARSLTYEDYLLPRLKFIKPRGRGAQGSGPVQWAGPEARTGKLIGA